MVPPIRGCGWQMTAAALGESGEERTPARLRPSLDVTVNGVSDTSTYPAPVRKDDLRTSATASRASSLS